MRAQANYVEAEGPWTERFTHHLTTIEKRVCEVLIHMRVDLQRWYFFKYDQFTWKIRLKNLNTFLEAIKIDREESSRSKS